MVSPAPPAVLFVCNLNRVRSPMAAGLATARFGHAIRAESCGLSAAEAVDPFAVAVMEELGVDLSAHWPRRLQSLRLDDYDLVVALTPQARRLLMESGPVTTAAVEYWPCADPTLTEGSRDQRLEAYRGVRDALAGRIQQRFGEASTSPTPSGR